MCEIRLGRSSAGALAFLLVLLGPTGAPAATLCEHIDELIVASLDDFEHIKDRWNAEQQSFSATRTLPRASSCHVEVSSVIRSGSDWSSYTCRWKRLIRTRHSGDEASRAEADFDRLVTSVKACLGGAPGAAGTRRYDGTNVVTQYREWTGVRQDPNLEIQLEVSSTRAVSTRSFSLIRRH